MPFSSALRPLTVALVLAGCSSSATTDTITPPPSNSQFVIQGADMSGYYENIRVSLAGAAAPGLTVTVNGTAMADQGGGAYFGHLAAALSAGTAVEVRASNGTLTGIGTAVVPVQPTVTDVQHTTVGSPVTVNWSATTSPDSFEVALNYHLPDNSAAAVIVRLPGSARQVVIPTTDIPANGTVFSLGIDAYNHGSFSGAAAATSDMHVRTSSASFALTIP